ncbi:TPA: 16S rRNA (cytidine(1402)-2'-O)-methyltransferase [Candidatus Campbellbacteria bacterium]|nr:MAG: uroporphyrin-III C/tetrapyrrole (Corrin/Porphyrin) methyltransferase, 16S rRNA (cytidine1402-2'-O)-methyltransferase [Candidatus Campbellbacteria bacterium GW2011_OD1_34_28]KKP75428.1 MAG: Ribosomal RNA small subunit methyltransferase I [Candidatus Campbellbacteria bacterium GW2011_GWD2_35_24]KKP76011.1 MAG: Ribosomal RNA small subunit methyltransferase I [Candidatus Campbellbacteria bacterium GW2011_GWC2_35_28]KKP77200.1 MAG: Ribosomal RNA small subunit methyltransferase I [Candidatus C
MKFYVIATPIGNLEDITFRAIKTLKEVDLILCEDTRVTKKLLQKYEINTPTMSYHQHSKISKIDKIFEMIEAGKNIALVSDAGTPTISDPGSFLVSEMKGKFEKEIEIIAIPGASALVSALSISGLPVDQFLFLGFLPHKKGRETLFKEIAETKRTIAFYESPHRILKTLESLKKHIGKRKVVIARELTKIYEETVSGSAEEIIEYFEKNPDKIRGEFVVMIEAF